MILDKILLKQKKHPILWQGSLIFLILFLGLIFFMKNVRFELATDDLAWLNGQTPTVFDRYRVIPRLFFTTLYRYFGPSPTAALTMIYLTHLANSILVYVLARNLFPGGSIGLIAMAVFTINPLTLGTLTWISCYSYVLGTLLALCALSAFWYSDLGSNSWPLSILAIASYVLGLFCSHEIFFLPLIFLVLGWFHNPSSAIRSGWIFGVSMLIGILINLTFYEFNNYGVDAGRLFRFPFLLAYISSVFAFGVALFTAFPISFFTPVLAFLEFCFSEPVRWSITMIFLIVIILLWKRNRRWKSFLGLTISFAALITPYIIRIALLPEGVNYHISYLLSGRVFYLPFTILSLVLGWFIISLSAWSPIKKPIKIEILVLICLTAYFIALFFAYNANDFVGLNVMVGTGQSMPPPWNPYRTYQPFWFVIMGLTIGSSIFMRLFLDYKRQ